MITEKHEGNTTTKQVSQDQTGKVHYPFPRPLFTTR